MAETTLIAWTDHTFNAWMGCTKVSAGCKNCYAENMTKNRMGLSLWGDSAVRQVTKSPWDNLKKWQKSAAKGDDGILKNGKHLVFLGSLMDWAEDRPELDKTRDLMWQAIRQSPDIWFQMLTKRPENIKKLLPSDWGNGYHNVWLGTSVENMEVADRVSYLQDIPAVVRFISYEPALGSLNDLDISGIDWVIFGGESGNNFRPMNIDWAREMRIKCEESQAAFFFKQSAAIRTEMGIELDGNIVRYFPTPR